jgi:hypothetical protein
MEVLALCQNKTLLADSHTDLNGNICKYNDSKSVVRSGNSIGDIKLDSRRRRSLSETMHC